MPRGGLLRLVYVALAWLCAGARSQTQFLTIGAPPVEMSAPPGTYVRFTIDIVNDYCAKAAVQARNLCIVSVTLVFGIGGMVIGNDSFSLQGISLCGVVAILLNLILPKADEEAPAAH